MAGIMRSMLNTRIVMEELGIIQRGSKELYLLYTVAMLKQIVITVVINMRHICARPHALLVREAD